MGSPINCSLAEAKTLVRFIDGALKVWQNLEGTFFYADGILVDLGEKVSASPDIQCQMYY